MSDFKNIQQGVEQILGTKTIVRRRKKSASDKKREAFLMLINSIEELNIRQHIMYADLDLDFSNYDEKFFNVVDILLYMNFGKQCTDLIYFYLYDRINQDGSINPLIVNETEELILESPYELWNLLCKVNPKIDE